VEGREKLDQSLVFIKFSPTYYIKIWLFYCISKLRYKRLQKLRWGHGPHCPTPGYAPAPRDNRWAPCVGDRARRRTESRAPVASEMSPPNRARRFPRARTTCTAESGGGDRADGWARSGSGTRREGKKFRWATQLGRLDGPKPRARPSYARLPFSILFIFFFFHFSLFFSISFSSYFKISIWIANLWWKCTIWTYPCGRNLFLFLFHIM
jgi:hypothetical protein